MKTVATWRVVTSILTCDVLAPVRAARVEARGWNNILVMTFYQPKGGYMVARNGDGSRRFQSGLRGDRLPSLKKLLQTERRMLRILKTHSPGLSGVVAEHAMGSVNSQTFDGIWSNSLTASLVRGMPDIEADENLLPVQKIVNLVNHEGEMSALLNRIPESTAARQIPEHAARNIGRASTNLSFQLSAIYARHRHFGRQSTGYMTQYSTVAEGEVRNDDEVDPSLSVRGGGASELGSNTPLKDSKVDPSQLLNYMTTELGMQFFAGVPDSCIATFCLEVDQYCKRDNEYVHAIAANEGSAVALAVGHYLATGKIPLVYMQNSGLGNAANPLLSAAHAEVYGIPMILLLGWRGSPGEKDEPQHMVTGRQIRSILDALEVESFILPKCDTKARETIRAAHEAAKTGNRPVAVLVEPKTFSGSVVRHVKPTDRLTREEAMSRILEEIGPGDVIVATTGFTSRELYALRESLGSSHDSDFLCVGR
jgi:sulfopyruvate decarboxylase TPP-binding subunit